MPAPSTINIANRALQLLGAARISAFDQDHPNAREVGIAYDSVRQDLLREYTWNFSISRASIPAITGETLYEGLNRYQKPNDFLRLLRQQFSRQGESDRQDWQIEGPYIITADASPLKIRYVADVENPVTMDASFREVLAARLAMNINEAVTGSSELDARVTNAETRALTRARQSNAFENPPVISATDDWLQARL